MKTAALFLAAVAVVPALATEYRLELKPQTTKIEWTLSDPIHTVHGTFQLKHGAIDFDTASGVASGEIVVDVASGESGGGTRDKRMHANVLESSKYPEAIFVPSRIEGLVAVPGTSDIKVHGVLTMHGAPHDMIMNARVEVTAEQAHATMSFDVPYVQWGMKDPSNFLIKVSKTVQVSIDASGVLATRTR